jgi:hypothetical protein
MTLQVSTDGGKIIPDLGTSSLRTSSGPIPLSCRILGVNTEPAAFIHSFIRSLIPTRFQPRFIRSYARLLPHVLHL